MGSVSRDEQATARVGTPGAVAAAALEPGERVVSFASVIWRAAKDVMDPAVAVLTGRRLLVMTAVDRSSYELRLALDREGSHLLNEREHSDGSVLLLLGHSDGVLCLYFPASWRQEARIFAGAFASRPEARAATRASDAEVDRFAIAMEFSGLTQRDAEDDG